MLMLNVKITNAFFANNMLAVALSDGHIVFFPCAEMAWLVNASSERQQDFNVASDSYGVWWARLDDGIPLHYILSPDSVALQQAHSESAVAMS